MEVINLKKIIFILSVTVFMGAKAFTVDFGIDTQKMAPKFKDSIKLLIKQIVPDDIQKTRSIDAKEEAIVVSCSLQILNLLNQITDELNKKDNKESEEVKAVFWDLCDYVSDVGEPKKHHIRGIEDKILNLNFLMDGKEFFGKLGESLVSKIKNFNELLVSLFNNKNLNLGGLFSEILDVIYHRPLEVVCKNKITSSVIAGSVVAASAIIFTWLKLKDKKKEQVDEDFEIEMEDLSSLDDGVNDRGKTYFLRDLPRLDYKVLNRTGKKNL